MNKLPWFKMNLELYNQVQCDIAEYFPSLRIIEKADKVCLIGAFEVRINEAVIDRFQLNIILPDNYPSDLPLVFETGARLPKVPDRHFNSKDESACLFLPDQRWKHWPKGSSFANFLSGPVNQFFINQIGFEIFGKWPLGERSHGIAGIIEYYQEELGYSDPIKIKNALEYLSKKQIKGHWLCPCGCGKSLRNCNWPKLLDLHKKVSQQQAISTLAYFKQQ